MNSGGNSKNPLEVINAHKAHGYGFTGNGQVVAVMDSGFFNNHDDLASTTITTTGDYISGTGNSVSADHGAIVTGIIAGNNNGSGIVGVAPSAALHISDFNYWSPAIWDDLVDGATNAGAVAQNNSWGFDQQYGAAGANVFVNYMNNNGLSGSETLVAFQSIDTNNDGYYDIGVSNTPKTWTSNDWEGYISSLDSFQSNGGIVVFALSNDDTKTDADISAALPELFSELQEAWIAVANVDLPTGATNHVLYSAPCGSTAEYCMSADGYDIVGLAADVTGTDYYWAGVSGSSFSAPQISGAVAILAEAFPNHSAEEITDRLLASANNVLGFTQTGSVTFGNGVVHGYSNEAGHGMLDIYAALQPITTSSSARNQIYAGSSSIGQSAFSLDSTRANLSRSFGDALEIGLANTNTYFYDALDGGFAVGMNDLAFSLNPVKPSLSVKSELSNLTSVSNKLLHFENTGWSETSDDRKGFFNASVSSSPSALNNFYLNAGAADLGFAAYSMPTLSGIQGGDGFNLGLNMGEGFLTTSFTQTNIIKQFRK